SFYADRFSKIIKEFGTEAKAEDLVTSIMIIHYLERVGDMFLEIGEKIIYVIIGEKIKLEQYKAMDRGLKAAGASNHLQPLDFRYIWGGRSGCRIGVVNADGASTARTVVFKHGPASKLIKERENLEIWSTLRPGLTPAVQAFVPASAGTEAALMLDFLQPRTLQSYFIENSVQAALNGLRLAFTIMTDIWRDTAQEAPGPSNFSLQAQERLPEATILYPSLMKHQGGLNQWRLRSIQDVLSQAIIAEEGLQAPFKCRIHGDFNLSNVLYNPENNAINLVDLYRSSLADYVQDVSVMMLSIIRLPLINSVDRRSLCQAALVVHALSERFAKEKNDSTFSARLTFGLARSFITSTRFVLEERLAARFVARARYLWEKLIAHRQTNKSWIDFKTPLDIINVTLD
ncbi:MAG: phosphotransferase, partial [Deltaproteobacteria bacterium]|nr:phosphotransferase [Deltaproteobacteria bacterium]